MFWFLKAGSGLTIYQNYYTKTKPFKLVNFPLSLIIKPQPLVKAVSSTVNAIF